MGAYSGWLTGLSQFLVCVVDQTNQINQTDQIDQSQRRMTA